MQQSMRAFRFPESIAYGKRGGRTALVERAICQALAMGHTVITTSPRKGGGTHTCTIYPFPQKCNVTTLLHWSR